MAAPYIPTTDAAFDSWSQNFTTLITANPTLYGLSSSDALTISNAVGDFHDAYLIAGVSGTPPKTPLSPSTRTPVTIAAKDSAKAACLPIVRFYGINVRNNAGVSNDDKTDLGLTIVKTTPTPIPAPVSVPLISFFAALSNSVQFTFRDSLTPTTKRKPFGATGLQIFVSYAATPPVTPTMAEFDSVATKSPFIIAGNSAQVGEVATLWGRWVTQRGLVGDFSSPITYVVPPGGT